MRRFFLVLNLILNLVFHKVRMTSNIAYEHAASYKIWISSKAVEDVSWRVVTRYSFPFPS